MELTILLLIVIILTILTKRLNKVRKSNKQRIDNLIEIKTKQLEELNRQFEEMTYDRSVSLTKSHIEALEIYEQSNIQLPVDIIEELSNMSLLDSQESIEYIENQRYYWKLENTKKPFKRKRYND